MFFGVILGICFLLGFSSSRSASRSAAEIMPTHRNAEMKISLENKMHVAFMRTVSFVPRHSLIVDRLEIFAGKQLKKYIHHPLPETLAGCLVLISSPDCHISLPSSFSLTCQLFSGCINSCAN